MNIALKPLTTKTATAAANLFSNFSKETPPPKKQEKKIKF